MSSFARGQKPHCGHPFGAISKHGNQDFSFDESVSSGWLHLKSTAEAISRWLAGNFLDYGGEVLDGGVVPEPCLPGGASLWVDTAHVVAITVGCQGLRPPCDGGRVEMRDGGRVEMGDGCRACTGVIVVVRRPNF